MASGKSAPGSADSQPVPFWKDPAFVARFGGTRIDNAQADPNQPATPGLVPPERTRFDSELPAAPPPIIGTQGLRIPQSVQTGNRPLITPPAPTVQNPYLTTPTALPPGATIGPSTTLDANSLPPKPTKGERPAPVKIGAGGAVQQPLAPVLTPYQQSQQTKPAPGTFLINNPETGQSRLLNVDAKEQGTGQGIMNFVQHDWTLAEGFLGAVAQRSATINKILQLAPLAGALGAAVFSNLTHYNSMYHQANIDMLTRAAAQGQLNVGQLHDLANLKIQQQTANEQSDQDWRHVADLWHQMWSPEGVIAEPGDLPVRNWVKSNWFSAEDRAKDALIPQQVAAVKQQAADIRAQAYTLLQQPYAGTNLQDATAKIRQAQFLDQEAAVYNDPTWSYSLSVDPHKEDLFREALVQSEMQNGAPLSNDQIQTIKNYFINPWDEMGGQIFFSVSSIIPVHEILGPVFKGISGGVQAGGETLLKWGDKLMGAAPETEAVGRGATKPFTYTLGQSLQTVASPFAQGTVLADVRGLFRNVIERLPVVGNTIAWLGTETRQAVAERMFTNAVETFTKVANSAEDTPAFQNLLEQSINAGRGQVMQPGPALDLWATVPASIGLRERNMLADLGTVIPPENWGGIIDDTVEKVSTRAYQSEYTRLILKGEDETTAAAKAGLFAQEFVANPKNIVRDVAQVVRDAYIDAHQVAPRLLDDNLMVLLAKKLDLWDAPASGIESAAARQARMNVRNGIQAIDSLSQIASRWWVDMTLRARPGWVFTNMVDSTFRYLISGGKIFDDLGLITDTNFSLAKQIEFAIPQDLMEAFARRDVAVGETVPDKLLAGWKPEWGPLSFIKGRWSELRPAPAEELGLRPLQVWANKIGAFYDLIKDMGKSDWPQIPGQIVKSSGGVLRDAFAAWAGGWTDFNAAMEFTLRLRLFHEHFSTAYAGLGQRALDTVLAEAKGSPAIRDLLQAMWMEAGYNPDRLASLVAERLGSPLPGRPLTWSLLVPPDLDTLTIGLSVSDRQLFAKQVLDHLRQVQAAAGDSFGEAHIVGAFNDIRAAIQDMLVQKGQRPEQAAVVDAAGQAAQAAADAEKRMDWALRADLDKLSPDELKTAVAILRTPGSLATGQVSEVTGFKTKGAWALGVARGDFNGMSLVHLDMAGMGAINKVLGHDAGDDMLKALAKVLRDDMGLAESAYHIHGDEFNLALKLSPEEAEQVAQDVARRFDEAHIVLVDPEGKSHVYTGSFVSYGVGSGATAAEADKAAERGLIDAERQSISDGKRGAKGTIPPGMVELVEEPGGGPVPVQVQDRIEGAPQAAPTPPIERIDPQVGARNLRPQPFQTRAGLIDNFKAAASQFAEVREVEGDVPLKVVLDGQRPIIEINSAALSDLKRGDIRAGIFNALADSLSHGDEKAIQEAFGSNAQWQTALRDLVSNPRLAAQSDYEHFQFIAGQLDRNPGLRSTLEGFLGRPLQYDQFVQRGSENFSYQPADYQAMLQEWESGLNQPPSPHYQQAGIDQSRVKRTADEAVQAAAQAGHLSAEVHDSFNQAVRTMDRLQSYWFDFLRGSLPGPRRPQLAFETAKAWDQYFEYAAKSYETISAWTAEVQAAALRGETVAPLSVEDFLKRSGVTLRYDSAGNISSFKWTNLEGREMFRTSGYLRRSLAATFLRDVKPGLGTTQELMGKPFGELVGDAALAWSKPEVQATGEGAAARMANDLAGAISEKPRAAAIPKSLVGVNATPAGVRVRTDFWNWAHGAFRLNDQGLAASQKLVDGIAGVWAKKYQTDWYETWIGRFQTVAKTSEIPRVGTLTRDALNLIAKVEAGGVPTQMTSNLLRIAQENGIDASKMGASDLVEALKRQSAAYNTSGGFSTWFGLSRAVTDQGTPLVLYHGTTADIAAFDPSLAGYNTGHPSSSLGIWFSGDPETAASFVKTFGSEPGLVLQEEANIIPVHLSIQNPYEINAGEFLDQHFRGTTPAEVQQFQTRLMSQGYDGLHIIGDPQSSPEWVHDNWVAFEPTQVKSIFNTGVYDPADPRLLYHNAPLMQNAAEWAHAKWIADPLWGNSAQVSDVYDAVMARMRGETVGDAQVAYAADQAARRYLEAWGASLLPEAQAGIQSQIPEGYTLVYRTARSAEEATSVLTAIEDGQALGSGFRSSRAHIRPSVEARAAAAEAKGQAPVFVSNFPGVAGQYRDYEADLPITFAIEVPNSAIVYQSNRAAMTTQGAAYSASFIDTELLIDANRINRMWQVPSETIARVTGWTQELADSQVRGTQFRNAFRDADPALAEAGAEALKDLREPPKTLGRPFLEAPLSLREGVTLQKGDRVLLDTGDLVKVKNATEIGPGFEQYNGGAKWRLTTDGLKNNPPGMPDSSGYNIYDHQVVRVVPKGQRIAKAELQAATLEGRPRLIARVISYRDSLQQWAMEASAKGEASRVTDLAAKVDQLSQWLADNGVGKSGLLFNEQPDTHWFYLQSEKLLNDKMGGRATGEDLLKLVRGKWVPDKSVEQTVDHLKWDPNSSILSGFAGDKRVVNRQVSRADLPAFVGKEVADQLQELGEIQAQPKSVGVNPIGWNTTEVPDRAILPPPVELRAAQQPIFLNPLDHDVFGDQPGSWRVKYGDQSTNLKVIAYIAPGPDGAGTTHYMVVNDLTNARIAQGAESLQEAQDLALRNLQANGVVPAAPAAQLPPPPAPQLRLNVVLWNGDNEPSQWEVYVGPLHTDVQITQYGLDTNHVTYEVEAGGHRIGVSDSLEEAQASAARYLEGVGVLPRAPLAPIRGETLLAVPNQVGDFIEENVWVVQRGDGLTTPYGIRLVTLGDGDQVYQIYHLDTGLRFETPNAHSLAEAKDTVASMLNHVEQRATPAPEGVFATPTLNPDRFRVERNGSLLPYSIERHGHPDNPFYQVVDTKTNTLLGPNGGSMYKSVEEAAAAIQAKEDFTKLAVQRDSFTVTTREPAHWQGPIPAQELKWTGLEDYLAQNSKTKLTKAEVLQYLTDHRPQMRLQVLPDAGTTINFDPVSGSELTPITDGQPRTAREYLSGTQQVPTKYAVRDQGARPEVGNGELPILGYITFDNGDRSWHLTDANQPGWEKITGNLTRAEKLAQEHWGPARTHWSQYVFPYPEGKLSQQMADAHNYQEFLLTWQPPARAAEGLILQPAAQPNVWNILDSDRFDTGFTITETPEIGYGGSAHFQVSKLDNAQDVETYYSMEQAKDAISKRLGKVPSSEYAEQAKFHSSGMTLDNPLIVHVRTTDHIDSQGRRVLMIEEIQSDWHQEGSKSGYRMTQADIDALTAALHLESDNALTEYQAADRMYNRAHDAYLAAQTPWAAANPDMVQVFDLDHPDTVLYQEPLTDYRAGNAAVTRTEQEILADPTHPFWNQAQAGTLTYRIQHNSEALPPELLELKQTMEQADEARALAMDNRDTARQALLAKQREIEASQENAVPRGPFADTYNELAINRMLRHAADNGYDAIGWTTGAEQTERWSGGLRAVADKLTWDPNSETLTGYKDGARVVNQVVPRSELQEAVGNEVAANLMRQADNRGLNIGKLPTVEGDQLVVGGQGFVDSYDKKIPKYANKVGGKFGVQAELGMIPTTLGSGETEDWEGYQVFAADADAVYEAERARDEADSAWSDARDELYKLKEANKERSAQVSAVHDDLFHRIWLVGNETQNGSGYDLAQRITEALSMDESGDLGASGVELQNIHTQLNQLAQADPEIRALADEYEAAQTQAQGMMDQDIEALDAAEYDTHQAYVAADEAYDQARNDLQPTGEMFDTEREAHRAVRDGTLNEGNWDTSNYEVRESSEGRLAEPDSRDRPAWILPLNDEMKASVKDGRPLFNTQRSSVTAAVAFDKDQKAILYAVQNKANVVSLVHEVAHILERQLDTADRLIVSNWAGKDMAAWGTPEREQFAKAFEKYLSSGEAPTPELQGPFAYLKQWILSVYQSISNYFTDVKVTPELKAVFDRLVAETPDTPEQIAARRPAKLVQMVEQNTDPLVNQAWQSELWRMMREVSDIVTTSDATVTQDLQRVYPWWGKILAGTHPADAPAQTGLVLGQSTLPAQLFDHPESLSARHYLTQLLSSIMDGNVPDDAIGKMLAKRIQNTAAENLTQGRSVNPYVLSALGAAEDVIAAASAAWGQDGSVKEVAAHLQSLADAQAHTEMQAAWDAFAKQARYPDGRSLAAAWGAPANSYETFHAYLRDYGARLRAQYGDQANDLIAALDLIDREIASYRSGSNQALHTVLPQALWDKEADLAALTPTAIPVWKMPQDMRTWLLRTDDLLAQANAALDGLDHWQQYLLGGRQQALVGAKLSQADLALLDQLGSQAVQTKYDLLNTVLYGGQVAGQRYGGVVPLVNKNMLTYTNATHFDDLMRTIMPFWMFPRRSLPFWAEYMTVNPWLPSLYYKFIVASQAEAYLAGGTTSDGHQLPSLEGYLPIPGTNIWINPTKQLSFKYLLPTPGQRYADTGEVNSVAQQTYNWLRDMGSTFGFSFAPWVNLLAVASGLQDTNTIQSFSLVPEMDLIPPWVNRDISEKIARAGFPNIPAIWKKYVAPEPSFEDYLIERQLLTDTNQKLQDPAASTTQKYAAVQAAKDALLGRENSDLWQAARDEIEKQNYYSQMVGFFTGIFGKQWTDANADFNTLRDQVNNLRDTINSDVGAAIFGLDPDSEQRYQHYIDRRYNTPEGYLSTLYGVIRFTQTSNGDPVYGQDRRDMISQSIHQDETTQSYFNALGAVQAQLKEKLAVLPVGSDPALVNKVWDEYFAQRLTIENSPMYADAARSWVIGYKPEQMLVEHYTDLWWQLIRETKPQWDQTGGQTYTDYQTKVSQWQATIPLRAAQLYDQFVAHERSQAIAQPQADYPKIEQALAGLKTQTTLANFTAWEMKNDTVMDALNAAWKATYWDPYWAAVSNKSGYERQLAETQFLAEHPAPPTTSEMVSWVQSHYALHQFRDQDLVAAANAQPPESIAARTTPKTDSAKLVNEAYDLLAMAGPGKGHNTLTDAYVALGGKASDFDVFYETNGAWHDPAALQAFVDKLRLVAQAQGLKTPDAQTLAEWIHAQQMNDDYRLTTAKKFGEDIWTVIADYLNGNTAERAAARKADPRIDAYYTFRDQYAVLYPEWAKYYYTAPTKKAKTSAGGGAGSGTTKKAGGGGGAAKKVGGGLANGQARDPLMDYLPMGYRQTLNATDLLGATLGKAGVPTGKPIWPATLWAKYGPPPDGFTALAGAKLVSALKSGVLSPSSVDALKGIGKQMPGLEPWVRRLLDGTIQGPDDGPAQSTTLS